MIRVGPAGWSYSDWEGIVYPRHKPRDFHPLRHVARYVECVEVNSTFYRTPRAEYAARWCEHVGDRPHFRFLAKLQDVFTHGPLPAGAADQERAVRAYLEGIEPLRASGKLAGILVQFPFSFCASTPNLARLTTLSRHFGHLPLVLEVRHRSWCERELRTAIATLGYSMALVDMPAAPDHPPQELPEPGPLGYLRLHGRNRDAWFDGKAGRDQRYDYLYSPSEIVELSQVARRLASHTDETYVITNNHFAGKAMANALDLLAALGDDMPLAPVELIEAYPHLRGRTRPDGQRTLFS